MFLNYIVFTTFMIKQIQNKYWNYLITIFVTTSKSQMSNVERQKGSARIIN